MNTYICTAGTSILVLVVYRQNLLLLSARRNFLTGDHLGERSPLLRTHIGHKVNNGVFHVDAGHEFLAACIGEFARHFDPDTRMSGGPDLMNKVLGRAEEEVKIGLEIRDSEEAKQIFLMYVHLSHIFTREKSYINYG